ncbi:MAG: lipopolysaccharide biosynthesis protein [Candidatus Binataceae bacterium]
MKTLNRTAAIAIHILLLVSVAVTFCVSTSSAATQQCRIFYLGNDDLVRERLALDPGTTFTDLAHAQVAVIQDALWEPGPQLDLLKSRISAGMGLVLILGPDISPAALDALTGGAVIQTGVVTDSADNDSDDAIEQRAAVIRYVGPRRDPLARWPNWRSATRIHERSIVRAIHARVLVATTRLDEVSPSAPVLLRLRIGEGLVYILTPWLNQGAQADRKASYAALLAGIPGAQNYDIQRWPYFNWLFYYLTRDVAGIKPVAYGSWIGAPVPHRNDAVIVGAIFTTLLFLFAAAFYFVRRYSLRHPELLDHFYRDRLTPHGGSSRGALLGAESIIGKADERWDKVGFHRPLSGFLYNYFLSIGIMMPLGLLITFYIQMNFVNPFVEARGEWAIIGQFMQIFFVLLDLGTTQAMVKYFAEFRVTDPRRAITYVQLAIWFHIVVGIIEIALLGLFAAILMPNGALAFLSWIVILHAVIQFPGLVIIFRDLFRALQRFDFSIFLIVIAYVLTPIIQMSCGIYGRRWGLMHPVFGEGMGVVFGFAIGSFIAHTLMIAISAIFYRAVGFRISTIFLAHFNRDTVIHALSYGLKLSGGRALAAAGTALVPFLMGRRLDNFLELNELFLVVFALTLGYLEASAYIFSMIMPSISESIAAGKMALTRRYIDQALRWGLIALAMLGAPFFAFSDIFIRGLLPHQFARAAAVIALMHLWRMIDFSSRLPDEVFQGTGRTGLLSWTLVAEHVSRIMLIGIFMKAFGFAGVFYAFILSSLLKSSVAWALMIRFVIKPVVSGWQTLASPAITAVVNYAILRAIAMSAWQRNPLNTGLIVASTLFVSLPICMFLSGWLGWDRTSIDEFREAADLVPWPLDHAARFALYLLEWGASLSPLEGRFPSKLTAEAAAEAADLNILEAPMR